MKRSQMKACFLLNPADECDELHFACDKLINSLLSLLSVLGNGIMLGMCRD